MNGPGFSVTHRYVRKVDCSGHINLRKNDFNKSASSGHKLQKNITRPGQVFLSLFESKKSSFEIDNISLAYS